jgi:hypothetical protein
MRRLYAAKLDTCQVLGGEAYEAIARSGESMTNAAMATYAFDQIDQARADLLRAD